MELFIDKVRRHPWDAHVIDLFVKELFGDKTISLTFLDITEEVDGNAMLEHKFEQLFKLACQR